MEWFQIFSIIVANFGMWLWSRSEARFDSRHMEAKLDANRDLIHAIHDEMKDFHFRLLEIEKRK